MSFKIVFDSSADIQSLSGVDFGITPLKIMTDEREFVDDLSLDRIEMLDYFKKYKGRSRSSCPSSGEYLAAFGEADNIFCVTITGGLSGSVNAANSAAREFSELYTGKNIRVIDSLSTGPENALIIEKLRDLILEGKDFSTINSEIDSYHTRTRLVFALESMNNLANNGRVSPIVAKMAGILGIRAIGRASDQGTLEMTDKCRGMLLTVETIVKNMINEGYSGGRVRLHHANNPAIAEQIENKLREKFPDANIVKDSAGGLCSFYAEGGGILVGFEI